MAAKGAQVLRCGERLKPARLTGYRYSYRLNRMLGLEPPVSLSPLVSQLLGRDACFSPPHQSGAANRTVVPARRQQESPVTTTDGKPPLPEGTYSARKGSRYRSALVLFKRIEDTVGTYDGRVALTWPMCSRRNGVGESWEMERKGRITLAQAPRNLSLTLCVTLWHDHVPVPCLISLDNYHDP